ncbi:lipocalin family protein [Winogradskyella tangerina]|uniref:lipocalin family protein n=1 Tax=Winogradskyella tangerina TaxID=2023240 RepID=UPI000DBE919C|nr:lipocalin family protein [Winogradskyella tangerina]
MKKYLGLLCLFIFSCSGNPETYIEHLNGYWEIEEVTLANGSVKQYQFNETIDYISINDSLKGFRKKLKPGINDTYFTSDDAEALVLKIENDSLHIYYTTPYAEWKESVLEATPSLLKVVNQRKDIYLYKRYTPINLSVE